MGRLSGPLAVAAGFGSIWVSTHRDSFLYRIDPESNTVVARIDVGQESCGALQIGFGKVWVGHCQDGEKEEAIEPATNQVTGSFIGGPTIVAFGALWSVSNEFDAVDRVDPTSYKVTGSVKVPGGWIVDGGGSLWVIDMNLGPCQPSGLISQIDPSTLKVVRTLQVAVSGSCPWLAYAFGALWLKPIDNSNLFKIDPSSGKTTAFTISDFEPLTEFGDVYIASDDRGLWLRTSAKTVSQIDPDSGRVLSTYPADKYSGGGYVALAFGSLWVANFAIGSVWRDRISG